MCNPSDLGRLPDQIMLAGVFSPSNSNLLIKFRFYLCHFNELSNITKYDFWWQQHKIMLEQLYFG